MVQDLGLFMGCLCGPLGLYVARNKNGQYLVLRAV